MPKATAHRRTSGCSDRSLEQWIERETTQPHTLVMGRVTYETLAHYDDGTGPLATMPKVMVSRTLTEPSWGETEIVGSDEALTALKAEPGPPLRIIGKRLAVQRLLGARALDRLRLVVFPLVLGETGSEPTFAEPPRPQARAGRDRGARRPARGARVPRPIIPHGMNLPLPIETSRLRLRPFVPGDVAGYHAVRAQRASIAGSTPSRPPRPRRGRRSGGGSRAPPRPGSRSSPSSPGPVSSPATSRSPSGHRSTARRRSGSSSTPCTRGTGTRPRRPRRSSRWPSVRMTCIASTAAWRRATSRRRACSRSSGCGGEAHLVENEWVKGEWQSELVYALLAREWRERA